MKTINFRQSLKEEELDFKIAYLIDSIALTGLKYKLVITFQVYT